MTDPVIVIVSGSAPHVDPWHALEATSAAIADAVSGLGAVRIVTTDEPDAAAGADLVIVNASADLAAPPASSAAVVDALAAHHAAGRPLLALHASALAFPDDERWHRILGGRWAPGVSTHPQIGFALVQPAGGELPAGAVPVEDFEVYDERYSALELRTGTVPVGVHTEDGIRHPLIWWRPAADGRGAVAYDALGHGVESFESGGHRSWLRRAVSALLAVRATDMEAAPCG